MQEGAIVAETGIKLFSSARYYLLNELAPDKDESLCEFIIVMPYHIQLRWLRICCYWRDSYFEAEIRGLPARGRIAEDCGFRKTVVPMWSAQHVAIHRASSYEGRTQEMHLRPCLPERWRKDIA